MEFKENILSFYQAQANLESKNPHIFGLREAAIEVFKEKGFPTPKEEEWKYTNLRPLLQNEYNFSNRNEDFLLNHKDLSSYSIENLETYKLVFVNGVYDPSLSSNLDLDENKGIEFTSLSRIFNEEKSQKYIEKYYGKIQTKGDSLSALNMALANDGAFIFIPKNTIVKKPIEILYISSTKGIAQFFSPRNLIIVKSQASLNLIERHICLQNHSTFTNSLTEIYLENGSELDYSKLQDGLLDNSFIDHTFISQSQASRASVHTFSVRGKFIRNNLNFYQEGELAHSSLNGLSLLDEDQLVDHHTLVDHLSPNCQSHQLYKTILFGNSKGVFNGKIKVDKEAQKINAFQKSAAILLSPGASINTKPQLEIFADDVKCSHGSTIGQLNKEALFYLQSRGIPETQAKTLLLTTFVGEVLEKVTNKALKDYLYKVFKEKLKL